MRALKAVAAGCATATMVVAGAVPATGGTGASQACSDTHGYQQVPINNGIVTIGAQLTREPTAPTNDVVICFSNTPPGMPSTLTGGNLRLFFGNTGGTSAPNVYANFFCHDDLEQQTVDTKDWPFYHCDVRNGVAVTITPTTVVPAGCAVYVVLVGCALTTAGVSAPVPRATVTIANVRVV